MVSIIPKTNMQSYLSNPTPAQSQCGFISRAVARNKPTVYTCDDNFLRSFYMIKKIKYLNSVIKHTYLP